MSDAPRRTSLLRLWAQVGVVAAAVAFDASINASDEGDPASSLAHNLLSGGPATVAVAVLGLMAAWAWRTAPREQRRTRGALGLTALGALYATGAFIWELVLETTTPHRQSAGALILCGVVGTLTGMVWLTTLWLRRDRQPVPEAGAIGRLAQRYGSMSYSVYFTLLAVLALSPLGIDTAVPDAAGTALGFIGVLGWAVRRVSRIYGRPVLPADVRPERPGDAASVRYLAPAGEGRIARSWRLSRVALDVVRTDHVMVAIVVVAVVMNLAATALLFDLAGWFAGPGHGAHRDNVVWLGLALAWPLSFLSTFLNVALAAAASARLDGQRLTLRAALGVALGRVAQIAGWSLLATGVGVLLQQVAQRIPFGGRVVSWVAGAAWSLVTFFAVPVLALEGCTATGCIRRSTRLIRDQWGEGATGTVTITAWAVVVAVPAGIAGAAAAAATGAGRDAVLAITLVVMAAIGGFATAVRQVFAVALYRYATDGGVRGGFDETDLQHPFDARRRWLRPRSA